MPVHFDAALSRRQRLMGGGLPLLALALAFSLPPAAAQDVGWVGGTSAMLTASNWSGNTVPNASNNAIFGATGNPTPSILVDENFFLASLRFGAAAQPYAFVIESGNGGSAFAARLYLDGAGIVNNAAQAPSFDLRGGVMVFSNNGTAANAAFTSSGGGSNIQFNNNSTASIATFNNVEVTFNDNATAANLAYTANNAQHCGSAEIPPPPTPMSQWAVGPSSPSIASPPAAMPS